MIIMLALSFTLILSSLSAATEVQQPVQPSLPLPPAATDEVKPVSLTKKQQEAKKVEERQQKERAEVQKEIQRFKAEQEKVWQAKVNELEAAVKNAQTLFNRQLREFDGKDAAKHFGKLGHWVQKNAELQEAKATLEYVQNLPVDMVLPVTELKAGVVQARHMLVQLHRIDKDTVNVALDAYRRRVAKEKGSDNKSPEFAQALKNARDSLASYYEILSQSYASLEPVFNQLWQHSADSFAWLKDQEIAHAERTHAKLLARAELKGFDIKGTQELTKVTNAMPTSADAHELTVPYQVAFASVDTSVLKERKQFETKIAEQAAVLKQLREQRDAIWQGQGDGRLVGKRELIEQRKKDVEQAEKVMEEKRNETGKLSDENHPFQKAAGAVKLRRDAYELDRGRFDAHEMVREVYGQIVQAARDIRLIDENTPMQSEQSRKGMEAFDREMALFKKPNIIGGSRLINRATGGIGKHLAQFKMMEPIKTDFENRLGYLRRLFPQVDLALSGCRWMVRAQAPGLL